VIAGRDSGKAVGEDTPDADPADAPSGNFIPAAIDPEILSREAVSEFRILFGSLLDKDLETSPGKSVPVDLRDLTGGRTGLPCSREW